MKRNYLFSSIPVSKKPRTTFPLSFDHKTSFEMGQLIPVIAQDVLPGDSFRVNATVLTRFTPLLAPVMHRCDVKIRYFFVPNRLLWNKWKEFITGGEDGTLEPVKLKVDLTKAAEMLDGPYYNSLFQRMGIGTPTPSGEDAKGKSFVDAMPIIAYWLIWQEYYRDQNFQDISETLEHLKDLEGNFPLDLGGLPAPNNVAGLELGDWFFSPVNKAWEKDYFTSALPWTQRGPDVTIPLGDGASAPVRTVPNAYYVMGDTNNSVPTGLTFNFGKAVDNGDTLKTSSSNVGTTMYTGSLDGTGDSLLKNVSGSIHSRPYGSSSLSNEIGIADLSDVPTITINQLRILARTQKWLEENAIGGGRYNEQILSHFGVQVPDYTIQRPVYLGGGTAPVSISEVLSTADTNGAPVGALAGKAVSVADKFGFKARFNEHGWIIGLMSVMPRTEYFQGIPRRFTKFDKFDYAFPTLAHLGEQAILNKEIWTNSDDPDGTWGYQSRYAEYKHNNDLISGNFADSYAFWHLARAFRTQPLLNASFVTAQPSDRIFATNDNFEHVQAWISFDILASRVLPKYGFTKVL